MRYRVKVVILASVYVTMAGCTDITQPQSQVSPKPGSAHRNATVATSDGDVPWYEDESQVPPEYAATIWDLQARASWDGTVADAYGYSDWTGNRGTLTLNMSILEGTKPVTTASEEHVRQEVFPHRFIIGRSMLYSVGAACGHVVNFHAHQLARLVLGIGSYTADWSTVSDTRRAYAKQPACPKEDEPIEGGGEGGGSGGGDGGTGGTATCETTTYEIQVWNGTEWIHEGYEYETVCY